MQNYFIVNDSEKRVKEENHFGRKFKVMRINSPSRGKEKLSKAPFQQHFFFEEKEQ